MYAKMKENDIANGPGVRVSVFMQGCDLHCPGCHNADIWDFDGGSPVNDEFIQKVLDAMEEPQITGISILGGEPLHPNNLIDTWKIISAVRDKYGRDKNIWLWTGYVFSPQITYMDYEKYNCITRDEAKLCYLQEHLIPTDSESSRLSIKIVLELIDVLVDGPFIQNLYRPGIGFRGSTNQRIIDMNESRCSNGNVYDVIEMDPIKDTTYICCTTAANLQSKNNELTIKIKYFDKEMERLQKIGDNKSDWIDLRAAKDITLKQGERCMIPLGVAMELPHGYEAIMAPRSSTFKTYGIIQTNSIGIIDESYKGDNDQWHFPAYAMRDTVINKFDRIAQFRIIEHQPAVVLEEVESLENEDRGGLGSTGVN